MTFTDIGRVLLYVCTLANIYTFIELKLVLAAPSEPVLCGIKIFFENDLFTMALVFPFMYIL